MQHEAMMTSLKALKLFGMARAADELAAQGAPAYVSNSIQYFPLISVQLFPLFCLVEHGFCDA